MIVDSTLAFAARRNIPVRYDRDLVDSTVKAMQRVEEIKARRERVFYKKRMEGNRERQRMADAKLVAENEHLLPKMRASARRALEMDVEGEAATLEEEVTVPPVKEPAKVKQRVKRRLLVGGGVEDVMETD